MQGPNWFMHAQGLLPRCCVCSNPAGGQVKHGRVAASLYNTTSSESAPCIQAEGFSVPKGRSQQKAGALLGPGVYVWATLQKALMPRPHCRKPCSTVTDQKEASFFYSSVYLRRCKTRKENDPMITTWQQNGSGL